MREKNVVKEGKEGHRRGMEERISRQAKGLIIHGESFLPSFPLLYQVREPVTKLSRAQLANFLRLSLSLALVSMGETFHLRFPA